MSRLTAEIMGGRPPRRSRRRGELIAEVARRLLNDYGTPTLGNRRDPVAEIFYIVLSARTADVQYRRTHRRLRAAFPTLESLASARIGRIAACIAECGLSNTRARHLRGIARGLIRRFGPRPAPALRKLPPAELFRELVALPGLAAKSALCVMMYSFDLDVFPVDVHVHRILTRLGILPRGLRGDQAQKLAPAHVPPGVSRALHIDLVLHGRAVCRAQAPKCGECSLNDLCPVGRRRVPQTRAPQRT